MVIITLINVVGLLYAYSSVKKEIGDNRAFLFYAGWLLCLTGLLGITITGDAFNIYVFLEVSSLSSYMLVAMANKPRSLTAAFNYLILGTIGASFILIGIGLLYVMTGTLSLVDIYTSLDGMRTSNTVHTAFVFILVGTLLKAAIFPFHFWQPNAHAYAPTTVSFILSGTATKVSFYVFLRFAFDVFGQDYVFEQLRIQNLLILFAIAAMIISASVAISQVNLKRLLAWSSIGQLGYIMLGICLLTEQSLTAAFVHMFNHAIVKTALFMAAGCFIYRLGNAEIANLRGIGKRMPYTMMAFILSGFGLIGVPLTNGFISKWYLLSSALSVEAYGIVLAIIISSLLAVVFIWRIVEILYFGEPNKQAREVEEAPISLLAPLWLMVLAIFYFGVNPQFPTDIGVQIAKFLLRTAS